MRKLLVVLAIAASAAAPPARANTYTVVFDASASWSQAHSAAVIAGGYLATITSAGEQAAVEAAILAASPPGNGAFWINLRENVECGYVWDTGEPRCYGNFFYGEPNNGLGGTPEDRGSLIWSGDLSRRGRWNDVPEAGLAIGGDVSRMGYVIEFGPLDSGTPCGTYVPVHKASFCNQPTVGAIVLHTQVTGLATGPGLIGRSIIDISQPPDGPRRRQPARVQATYNVSLPVPSGATAAAVGTALRDSINSQIGGAGFVANFVTSGDPTLVRMFRASGNYSSSDMNTAPGITLNSSPGPTPGGGGGVPGPGVSDAGLVVLAMVLAVLGGRALRRRERTSA
jgi:hypothetical protein